MAPPVEQARELTHLQRRFVEEYLIDLNAYQAAIRAGYSPESAQSNSYRFMENEGIAAAIAEAMQARGIRTQTSGDDVVLELKRIGFSDLVGVITWDDAAITTIKASKDLKTDERRAIKTIKATKRTRYFKDGESETTHEISLQCHDKVTALALLGKHLGLFPISNGRGLLADHSKEPQALDLSKLSKEEVDQLNELRNKMRVSTSNDPHTIEGKVTRVDESTPDSTGSAGAGSRA